MTYWKIRPCFRSPNTRTRKCLKSLENPYYDIISYQIRFGGDPCKPLRPNTIFFTMAPVRRRSATSRRLPRCRRALKSDPKEGVAKMTIFIVMLCLSALALACSIFSFLQRGPVLSTNFIVSKKWAKKRKNYYFCGFIFALFTIGFLLLGISALLRVAMLTYVAAILFVLTAITAIAFSIYTASSWCARQVSVRTRPATWSSELEVSKLQARCFSFRREVDDAMERLFCRVVIQCGKTTVLLDDLIYAFQS